MELISLTDLLFGFLGFVARELWEYIGEITHWDEKKKIKD